MIKYIIESGRQVELATIRSAVAHDAERFIFSGVSQKGNHYVVEGTRPIFIDGFPLPVVTDIVFSLSTYKYKIPIEEVEVVM